MTEATRTIGPIEAALRNALDGLYYDEDRTYPANRRHGDGAYICHVIAKQNGLRAALGHQHPAAQFLINSLGMTQSGGQFRKALVDAGIPAGEYGDTRRECQAMRIQLLRSGIHLASILGI